MKPAATRRMVRPKKLLETEVPSAEFFLSADGVLAAGDSDDPEEDSVADDPTVLLAIAEVVVAVEFTI